MGIRITVGGVAEVGESIWLARVPPHEVATRLGNPSRSIGARTVLLVSGARYDANASELSFDASDAQVLNVGGSEATVVVGSDVAASVPLVPVNQIAIGSGDSLFLGMVRQQMAPEAAAVGEHLLKEVRLHIP